MLGYGIKLKCVANIYSCYMFHSRPSDQFWFRINFQNYEFLWEFWYSSLNRGLAHYKACTYTGQHNIEICKLTTMLWRGFKPMILEFK